MPYYELYVNRILSLCKERKLSINKLAGRSGLKQSTIENILEGKSKNPTITTLHKIALGFDMTLPEFLDFEALYLYSFDDNDDK